METWLCYLESQTRGWVIYSFSLLIHDQFLGHLCMLLHCQLLSFLSFLILFLLKFYLFFICMGISEAVRRKALDPLNWCYKWLWATMWVLKIKPPVPLAANALRYWAIPSAPPSLILRAVECSPSFSIALHNLNLEHLFSLAFLERIFLCRSGWPWLWT